MNRVRALIYSSPSKVEYNVKRPGHNPYASQMSNPGLAQPQPYNCNIKTEHQVFVNQEAPPRRNSSESACSVKGQPPHTPFISQDGWHFETPSTYSQPPTIFENHGCPPLSSFLETAIPVTGNDRPLLDHFIDNVLRLAFPVLEVHSQSIPRLRAILDSLKTNKSYFHCCLSVSAIHLKTTMNISSDRIDHDVMRHRYGAISQLCKTLSNEAEHKNILDATLAMVFYHCSVGAPDDYLPDIPWHDHFQAAANLVEKLEISSDPHVPPPFSMSLTTWIDILGATMLGKAPKFAPTYRRKHLTGTPSGLRELMGCDDRIMYLISEISCLEALKSEGRIDDLRICQHVSALGGQLEFTEPADTALTTPYNPSGAICPEKLTTNISAVFRAAARIYLCTLIPGINRDHPNIAHLVATVVNILPYIPSGPYGFDRSLVWPLLITGAYSGPSSPFRRILVERAASLSDVGDFGSFGRMCRVLQEVWRLTDEPVSLPTLTRSTKTYIDPETLLPLPGLKHNYQEEEGRSPSPPISYTLGLRSIKRQQVQWRDVMVRNGWKYLLI